MTEQATLFDIDQRGRTRRNGARTSAEAAAGISGETERAILAWFDLAVAGLTDDELCALLPGHHSPTVKSARSRLSNAGLLVATSETRPSNRGRAQTVWTSPSQPSQKKGSQ